MGYWLTGAEIMPVTSRCERGECRLRAGEVGDHGIGVLECRRSVAAGRHADTETTRRVGGGHVEGRVADGDRALRRPVACSLAGQREELGAVFSFAAERSLARGEEGAEAETIHPSVRDCGWVSGQKPAPLDCRGRFGRMRTELPMARVGLG